MDRKEVTIYTDGACLANGTSNAVGGWGAVMVYGTVTKQFYGKIASPTTNNRAELIAMIEALKALTAPCKVTLYSDSQITVNCANKTFMPNANSDLWEVLEKVVSNGNHIVSYVWIRKDSHPMNIKTHDLANSGATSC